MALKNRAKTNQTIIPLWGQDQPIIYRQRNLVSLHNDETDLRRLLSWLRTREVSLIHSILDTMREIS
jgi:hypothetical protein